MSYVSFLMQQYRAAFIGFFWLLLGGRCWAFALPPSQSLDQLSGKAQVIVVGKILSYTQDPNYPKPSHPGRGMEYLQYYHNIKNQGFYEIAVEDILKGRPKQEIRIWLPTLITDCYGHISFPVDTGSRVMLFLNRPGFAPGAKTSDLYVPVSIAEPMIPLSATYVPSTQTNTPTAWVISALKDVAVRKVEAFFLRDAVGADVVVALAPYISDPNVIVRGYVLWGLAANQQVSAIPLIRTFCEQSDSEAAAINCSMTLESYNTSEAVPYLNPLLFSRDYFTRFHTMSALDKLANQASIPYLMIALHDPGDLMQASACGNLRRVITPNAPMESIEDYAAHQTEELAGVYKWWNDELNGKHLPKDDRGPTPVPENLSPNDLNTLLFSPYRSVRETAITRLEKSADKTSIPYLILALHDPDHTIAYRAISILGRLIHGLAVPGTFQDFVGSPDRSTQPVYAWWSGELTGKHV